MIFASFPSFDACLWFLTIAAYLTLCARLRVNHAERRYPAFCAYIYFTAFLNIGTVLAIWVYPGGYLFFYAPMCLVAYVLMAFVAREVYSYVFGPKEALPEGTPRTVAVMLAVSVTAAAALGSGIYLIGPSTAMRAIAVSEFILTAGTCSSLWVLIFHSRRLGISWSPFIASIAIGFVLYLTTGLLARFVQSNGFAGSLLALRTENSIYFISLGWWAMALWKKEYVPERATSAQNNLLLFEHRQNMKEAARVFGIEA